ncbi:hypothetical protein [Streptomyces rhizosphaerihabitans]|uniref:hypothetical protein n=1 Tax=Streptomyces rhizosphaerihabitans TaxID=1266770 RepID=UPI0021BE4118|nr:hypothetical protein [Streptomyces rhizosphaerihabitans]MCT9011537.1 hypothetical protein [Streptomyces rhizosphaerihabitans]
MTVALVLLTAALVTVLARLAATAAGILTRVDGATIPAVLVRAARAFAAVPTLACAVIATKAAVIR